MPALKRLHALVLGSVQGVNYRLFVRHVAGVHRLVGWVKNLDDGRVEVLAEGEEHALKEFVPGTRPAASSRDSKRFTSDGGLHPSTVTTALFANFWSLRMVSTVIV